MSQKSSSLFALINQAMKLAESEGAKGSSFKVEYSQQSGEERIHEWCKWADAFEDSYFDQEHIDDEEEEEYLEGRVKFDIEAIYENGDVLIEYFTPEDTGSVLLQTRPDRRRAACTCGNCFDDDFCPHVGEAIFYWSDLLEDRKSMAKKRVTHGTFDYGEVDLTRFKQETLGPTIAFIEELAKRLEGKTGQDINTSLPSIETGKRQERLVWNLRTRGNLVAGMTPLVQSMKKSGKGFTKGQEVGLNTLVMNKSHLLSDIDRNILRYQGRHSGDWKCEMEDLLGMLAGADHVELDGISVAIDREMPLLKVVETKDTITVELVCSRGDLDDYQIGCGESTLAAIDFNTPHIVVMPLPKSILPLVVRLCRLPPVDISHKEAFLQGLKQLQGKLPIALPDGEHGELRDDPCELVLLLRSRPDGQLDYGVRIKTQSGGIALPGEGNAIEVATEGDRQVQWVRRGDREISKANAICNMLHLKPCGEMPFTDTLASFEDSLALLERLEQHRDDVSVLWDDQSKGVHRVVGSLRSSHIKVEVTTKRNWFGVGGECKIGGEAYSLNELLDRLDGTKNPVIGEFVQVKDGQWARIEDSLRENLEKLRAACHTDRKSLVMDATAAPALEGLANLEVELQATKAWQDCMNRLALAKNLEPTLPEGLQAELRDYQFEGYCWLRRLSEWGVGGVLADDMGLGKTLQTLAVLLDRAEHGPTLILAPTSVGFNWMREAARFAPSLNPILYRESDRHEILADLKPGDLVVSSYGIALRDGSELSKVKWGTLVMDEAQAIKNARTKTAQTISTLNAKWTIALTGTPMENHLGELWSLFNAVAPGVFGGWESFRAKYAAPIEKSNDPIAKKLLSQRLKPFILRRTKEEVLTELPPRTEAVINVELSPAERSQYELVRRSAIGELDNIVKLPDQKDQRFRILALLTRLRQFACHPGIVNKEWNRSSAKLDQLCETLQNLREEGHRALVFSQFTEHLGLIRKALDEQGISYQYLDGSTPAKQRQGMVDAFQNGDSTAFLISLKAGGTGLNLTAADYVIHMDPWWNPAVEDQATDRAHRFGQDKPVMVYRLVAKDTIEEEILALHASKRDLVEGILEGSGDAAKFSTEDLASLIRG